MLAFLLKVCIILCLFFCVLYLHCLLSHHHSSQLLLSSALEIMRCMQLEQQSVVVDNAIDRLLDCNLPSKYALTGRLRMSQGLYCFLFQSVYYCLIVHSIVLWNMGSCVLAFFVICTNQHIKPMMTAVSIRWWQFSLFLILSNVIWWLCSSNWVHVHCRWHWSNIWWFLWCWTHEAGQTTHASVALPTSASEHQKTNTLCQYWNSVVSTIKIFFLFELLFIKSVMCRQIHLLWYTFILVICVIFNASNDTLKLCL